MGITEFLITYCTALIEKTGYAGILVLMVLESMVAPVPSEAVMPFAGFLWFEQKFGFWPIVFFSTLGSIIGSLISYYIGAYGGKPLVRRFGKYFFLNEHHLEKTEEFFAKYGDKTIFISRFVPIVRHLISLPAGVGRMNIYKFIIYTVVGAGLWNAFLTYLGFQLGHNWELIRKYSEILDIIMVILIIAFVVYLFLKARKKRTEAISN